MSYFPSNFYIFVDSVRDLPKPVAGVITLRDDFTYVFTGVVDLAGSRLVCGENTTIIGGSSENCRIISSGLNASTALISSEFSLPLKNISMSHGTALDLDADGNDGALDWLGVNFINCATIGTIANYDNVIWTDCGVLNSSGLTFDGSIGTVGFSQCIFDASTAGTVITLPSTLTITRRFRIIYSAFVALSGETGINASTSATIPVEGYILDTCNFSGGGTYTTGVAFDDNKSRWKENRGIENSAEIGYYTMIGNGTATTISATSTPVKVAGTTTLQSISQKFSSPSSNRATYIGAITRNFKVSVEMSVSSGNGNQVGVYVAKNGTVIDESENYATTNAGGRAENIGCQTITNMSENDYIEIFVENATATNNITVSELSVIIESLN